MALRVSAISILSKRLRRINISSIIAVAIRNNSKEIADLNRDQLLRSERDDTSKIQNQLNKRTTYAPNPKNISKGRVGGTYTLFDKGNFHKGIKAEVTGDEVKAVGKDSNTNKIKAIYDDKGSVVGFQSDSIEKARQILREDLIRGFREAFTK